MSETDVVAAKWAEVKAAVDELELDVQKNSRGNAAAGVRTRKGLRALRKQVTDLVKLTVSLDKDKKAAKAAEKAAAAATKA
jgi:hypothetical protein